MRGRGRHILNGTRTFQWIGSMDRWHGGWREAARVPASPIFFYICAALHHHGWHQTSASLPFQLRLGKSNSPRILQAFYTWIELLRHLISWLRNLVLCSVHHWFTQPLIEYRKQTTEIHETNTFGGKVYSWKQKCPEICVIGAEWGRRTSKTRSQRVERSGSLEPEILRNYGCKLWGTGESMGWLWADGDT